MSQRETERNRDRETHRERRTQVIIGRLQGRTSPPQDVHLEDRLRLDIHREGGDGPLVDALGHAVVQTLDQPLHLAVELRQALAILWLSGERSGSRQKEEEVWEKKNLIRSQFVRRKSDPASMCVCFNLD